MKFKLLPAAALMVVSSAHSANISSGKPLSGCEPSERIVFECQTGKKMMSLCASPALSASDGVMQYRFGKKGKPAKLVIPAGPTHPSKFAEIETDFVVHNTFRVKYYQVRVHNKAAAYELFWIDGIDHPHGEASLTVNPNGKNLIVLECKPSTIHQELSILDSIAAPPENMPIPGAG